MTAAYTGPLDIQAGALVAYSQRAMSAAKRGSPLYTLRRDSDDTTLSFDSDTVTGDAPVSDISAFIDGGSGFVGKWNDQSANGADAVQDTNANQPAWLASVVNDRPGLSFVAATQQFLNSVGTVHTLGSTTFFIVGRLIPFDQGAVQYNAFPLALLGGGNDSDMSFFTNTHPWTANDLKIAVGSDGFIDNNGNYGSTDPVVGLGNSFFLIDVSNAATVGPGAVTIYWNGASLTVTDGSYGEGTIPAFDATVYAPEGFADGGVSLANEWNGELLECIAYPAVISDAKRLAIRQNIAAYYGIALQTPEPVVTHPAYTPNSPITAKSVLGNSGSAVGGVEEIDLASGLAFDVYGKLSIQNTGPIPISPAQLAEPNSTPIEIIPAGGDNTIIEIVRAVFLFTAGDETYDVAARVTLYYDGQTMNDGHSLLNAQADITGNLDFALITDGKMPQSPIGEVTNRAVVLASPDGDNTLGNGGIRLTVYYRTIAL